MPAVASAHSATTTLRFTAVQKSKVMFSGSEFGEQDTDVNTSNKTIGFDMLHVQAMTATTGALNVAIDLSGGHQGNLQHEDGRHEHLQHLEPASPGKGGTVPAPRPVLPLGRQREQPRRSPRLRRPSRCRSAGAALTRACSGDGLRNPRSCCAQVCG